MSVPHPSAAQFKLAAASFRRSQAFRGIFVFFVANFIQPQKSTLKIGNPKRKLIFQPSFFRGYVKFRGCRAPIWGGALLYSDCSNIGSAFQLPWPTWWIDGNSMALCKKLADGSAYAEAWSAFKLWKKHSFREKDVFSNEFPSGGLFEQRTCLHHPNARMIFMFFLAEIREVRMGPFNLDIWMHR